MPLTEGFQRCCVEVQNQGTFKYSFLPSPFLYNQALLKEGNWGRFKKMLMKNSNQDLIIETETSVLHNKSIHCLGL